MSGIGLVENQNENGYPVSREELAKGIVAVVTRLAGAFLCSLLSTTLFIMVTLTEGELVLVRARIFVPSIVSAMAVLVGIVCYAVPAVAFMPPGLRLAAVYSPVLAWIAAQTMTIIMINLLYTLPVDPSVRSRLELPSVVAALVLVLVLWARILGREYAQITRPRPPSQPPSAQLSSSQPPFTTTYDSPQDR